MSPIVRRQAASAGHPKFKTANGAIRKNNRALFSICRSKQAPERAFMERLAAARIDDVAHKRPEDIMEDLNAFCCYGDCRAGDHVIRSAGRAGEGRDWSSSRKTVSTTLAWRKPFTGKKIVVIKKDHDHHM